jgi:tetratricopeptide (TPR) repeat protein
VGNEEYLVRTERVAPGVPLAEEQVTWAVETWLNQARQLMNDPLLGLLQGDAALENRVQPEFEEVELPQAGHDVVSDLPMPSSSLMDLGYQLYGALFQGTLRDSWLTAQGIAQHRREALRLRLGLKGSRLPRLPWEVLHGTDVPIERFYQQGGLIPAPRPLATGTHVIFSRYQPSPRLTGDRVSFTVEPDQPLRVLMAIATPSDQERLELYREATQLQQELRTQTNALPDGFTGSLPDIQLTILNQPGREQLTQTLEQGRYHIFHYSGHSDLGANGGRLYLVNSRTGLTEILSGDDLAGLLVNNGIRLAIFNSCRGAYTASAPVNERERNLAESLVSRGVPAVLAMAEQIPDNVALTLTWLFYRNLKLGYPIDLSLSRARQGLISAYGSNQLYWALPILYLHPEFDGYLTPGDRSLDNPADRLILSPHNYGSAPALAGEEALPAAFSAGAEALESEDDAAMITSAVLADDDPGDWADTLDYSSETDDEDVSVVADLIRQLTPQSSETSQLSGAESEARVGGSSSRNELAPSSDEPIDRSGSGFATVADSYPDMPSHASSNGTVRSGRSNNGAAAQSDRHESTDSRRNEQGKLRSSRKRADRRLLFLPLAGATAAVAIALLLPLLPKQVVAPTPTPSLPPVAGPVEPTLQTIRMDKVKQIAINDFANGQFDEGREAITVLLDRDALDAASTALAAVPAAQTDDAEINFLRGRLVWQAMKQGDANYTVEEARQYWEKAANAQPAVSRYAQALGFAYYAEGNLDNAKVAWNRALALAENQPAEPVSTNGQTNSTSATTNKDSLTTYAGIALILWKQESSSQFSEQEPVSSKAAKIYQLVVSSDPDSFQPDALRKNWLWQNAAIQDWEKLAKVQP